MANPWDPFPFPLKGDQDRDETIWGVGLVCSEWESIEFNLARLYSVFAGQGPSGDAVRDYGDPKIFRNRLIGIQRIAATYFTKRCDQRLEGGFHRICSVAEKFAERRNDVAHGLVMEVSRIKFFARKLQFAVPGEKQYVVVPGFQTLRNHDVLGMPAYAYSSIQLEDLAMRLFTFSNEISAYRNGL